MSKNIYCASNVPCICSCKADCRFCKYEIENITCPIDCSVCVNHKPIDKSRVSEYSNNKNRK